MNIEEKATELALRADDLGLSVEIKAYPSKKHGIVCWVASVRGPKIKALEGEKICGQGVAIPSLEGCLEDLEYMLREVELAS